MYNELEQPTAIHISFPSFLPQIWKSPCIYRYISLLTRSLGLPFWTDEPYPVTICCPTTQMFVFGGGGGEGGGGERKNKGRNGFPKAICLESGWRRRWRDWELMAKRDWRSHLALQPPKWEGKAAAAVIMIAHWRNDEWGRFYCRGMLAEKP